MNAILKRGITVTAGLWPDIRVAYGWVYRAAHILANKEQFDVNAVKKAYDQLITEMASKKDTVGSLSDAITNFQKITKSYEPGLFYCYGVADLPHTNNDLEQYFGTARYQERRATGRKGASPTLVVRGSVQMIASVASRICPLQSTELRPTNLDQWRKLRQKLDYRHEARRAQLRFRKDPAAYLAKIEEQLLKPSLPS